MQFCAKSFTSRLLLDFSKQGLNLASVTVAQRSVMCLYPTSCESHECVKRIMFKRVAGAVASDRDMNKPGLPAHRFDNTNLCTRA
jgi:hypothetical protein